MALELWASATALVSVSGLEVAVFAQVCAQAYPATAGVVVQGCATRRRRLGRGIAVMYGERRCHVGWALEG